MTSRHAARPATGPAGKPDPAAPGRRARLPVALALPAGLLAASLPLLGVLAGAARAQPAVPPSPPGASRPGETPEPSTTPLATPVAPVDRNAPVTFTAEAVEYDENSTVVTASGNVEAWQGERILRADRLTYNRTTGVATAEGNVQLLEPNGQVLFAERAELEPGLRDGVIEGVRALLAQNGRLAANGARRTDGAILDLSRPVYTACDLCAENPEAPPLWTVRSRLATRDETAQRIRFRDAQLNFGPVPVFWMPYLSFPDPSAPRSSGFLTPAIGQTRFLGGFVELPYYWAIDPSSDLTVTPSFQTNELPSLSANYRRRFNFGEISAEGSVGRLSGGLIAEDEKGVGAHIFSRGSFTIDENWRTGFSLNRASSETYLRAFRFGTPRVLASNAYAEGFWGAETFARADARAYQGLRSADDTSLIPFVLPNLYADHVFATDALGGTLSADVWGFYVTRSSGTDTARLAQQFRYELPRIDAMGGVWTFRAQTDALAYAADEVNETFTAATNPNYDEVRGNVRVALDWRLPLVRSAGSLGRQLIEPRVQLVSGPSTGRQREIPNEDSLDFEFTDMNLFELNRFTGRDRLEGGTRLDTAFRSAWLFPNGGQLEGMVGRSFRASDGVEFAERSGLRTRDSDWVARARLSPTPWLDLTARTRLDSRTADRRLIDGQASLGLAGLGGPDVSLTGGYLYSVPSEALIPRRFRREVYGSASAGIGRHWRVGGFGRYDIEIERPVSIGANLTYEDECLVFDARFSRSYAEQTNSQLYPSSNTLLFRVGLKTMGDLGFRAL